MSQRLQAMLQELHQVIERSVGPGREDPEDGRALQDLAFSSFFMQRVRRSWSFSASSYCVEVLVGLIAPASSFAHNFPTSRKFETEREKAGPCSLECSSQSRAAVKTAVICRSCLVPAEVLPFYLSRDILQEFEEGELEFGDEDSVSTSLGVSPRTCELGKGCFFGDAIPGAFVC